MNDIDRTVSDHLSEECARRNEQLRLRLEERRTFEELLAILSALKGFNVPERTAAA